MTEPVITKRLKQCIESDDYAHDVASHDVDESSRPTPSFSSPLAVLHQKTEQICDHISSRPGMCTFPAVSLMSTVKAITTFGEIRLEDEQSRFECSAQLDDLIQQVSLIEYRLKQKRHIWFYPYARKTRKMLQVQSLVAHRLRESLYVRDQFALSGYHGLTVSILDAVLQIALYAQGGNLLKALRDAENLALL